MYCRFEGTVLLKSMYSNYTSIENNSIYPMFLMFPCQCPWNLTLTKKMKKEWHHQSHGVSSNFAQLSVSQVMYIEIDGTRWKLRDRHNKISNTGAIFHGNLVVSSQPSNKNTKSWLSVPISKILSVPGLHCVYLHGGAVALVSISKPAFPCCTLVQVNVLNVDIHTDHTSKAEHTDSGGVGHRCVTK